MSIKIKIKSRFNCNFYEMLQIVRSPLPSWSSHDLYPPGSLNLTFPRNQSSSEVPL